MKHLPQEIHDRIVFYLTDGARKPGHLPVVAASRKFQVAIERLAFRGLRLCSHNLDDFDQIMSSRPERRFYLKCLSIALCPDRRGRHISCTQEVSPHADFETDVARAQVNEASGRALYKLFEILASWCQDTSKDDRPYFGLRISNRNHGRSAQVSLTTTRGCPLDGANADGS